MSWEEMRLPALRDSWWGRELKGYMPVYCSMGGVELNLGSRCVALGRMVPNSGSVTNRATSQRG